jgi:hypothetical protein
MDVDGVRLGVDFVKHQTEEVGRSSVLLAVIGRNWIDFPDESGARRLDNPEDFVRIEIRAALQRDIPVIPILINGARVPRSDRLPADVAPLAFRNGLDLRHASFHLDLGRLVDELKPAAPDAPSPPRIVTPVQPVPPVPVAPPAPPPPPGVMAPEQRSARPKLAMVLNAVLWLLGSVLGFVVSWIYMMARQLRYGQSEPSLMLVIAIALTVVALILWSRSEKGRYLAPILGALAMALGVTLAFFTAGIRSQAQSIFFSNLLWLDPVLTGVLFVVFTSTRKWRLGRRGA